MRKGQIEVFMIAILALFIAYCGLKATLERMIIDNYVKREMHILPDKPYWADEFYMDLCGKNLMFGCHNFYRAQYEKI